MKRVILLMSAIIFSVSFAFAQMSDKVNYFTGTFKEAMVKSAKVDKDILIIGHTEWCGYCKKMKRTTLVDKGVIDYLNKNYLVMSIDMEKGEGPVIAKKYGIRSYPTSVVVDKSGKVKKFIRGYKKADKYISSLK
ncbi:MAG: thioredoxin fold domain-containing protein [Bacteroidales bacterium]|jgi:thioredoxin-related protein|nr:thioredoxin fold domain-containing protein [Bacteroidales bacterium]